MADNQAEIGATSGPTAERATLTEAERESLRLAHWPVDPPRSDSAIKAPARIETAVEDILAARTAEPRDDLRAAEALLHAVVGSMERRARWKFKAGERIWLAPFAAGSHVRDGDHRGLDLCKESGAIKREAHRLRALLADGQEAQR